MSNQLARFAATVRAGRKAKGWTQEKLAAEAEVSPESISNIERAKFGPTFEVVAALVASLGLNAGEIFGHDKRLKKLTVQRLNDEASLAVIIRDLDDDRVGLLLDIAGVVRGRADEGGRRKV
jgi:transcriptional regulator with XRE-family HTH domain